MSRSPRFVLAASIAVVVAAVAAGADTSHQAVAPAGPARVGSPVAPAARAGLPRERSALAAVRRALRWLLAAEAGHPRRLPARTFTDHLASDLAVRPPRPVPRSTRTRLRRVQEQTGIGSVRRVLATVLRAGRIEHLALLVICRPDCRVTSIE